MCFNVRLNNSQYCYIQVRSINCKKKIDVNRFQNFWASYCHDIIIIMFDMFKKLIYLYWMGETYTKQLMNL